MTGDELISTIWVMAKKSQCEQCKHTPRDFVCDIEDAGKFNEYERKMIVRIETERDGRLATNEIEICGYFEPKEK